ncbi:ROK family protein [Sphingomonas sp. SUN039]|uniref:ROK family protein n=1 Tax=Sphingomonas sp. SUN039 TaxID=2937787 RepID=UPI0028697794|nr:ROK family protein [Sphingomonas sp. SUN039]
MRIVDVAAFYTPHGGGVKTYIDRKMIAGPAAGHEIVCVAPGPENRVEERGPNARIIYLKDPAFPLDRKYHYFRDVEALYATLDELKPDIVEASSPWRSARLVGEWPGAAPRTLIMHSDIPSAYGYRWFGSIASRETIDRAGSMFWQHLLHLNSLFEATVTIAGDHQRQALDDAGLVRLKPIPMGVEPGLFSPSLRDEAFRARLLERCDLPPEATLLLGAGRHGPEKRWPMVIEAVTAAGAGAPVGFVLAGDGRDRAKVARAAARNPHIHLLSPVTDRQEFARLMASCDALVHGCEAEVFCTVGAEARASGLPLIMPDLGGGADHARLSDGWVYKSADKASLADTILDFVAAPRDAVRTRALFHAQHVRTIDEHFTDLFAYYETLVGHPRTIAPVPAAARDTAPVVAAVELGGTKINIAIGSHPDRLLAETVVPTTTPAETLRAVEAFLDLHRGSFTAIGIASFGPVGLDEARPDWGHITRTTKPGWTDTSVAPRLAKAFGVPVAFDTDVNGAALGEYRWGALAGASVGVYLTVGTGVGGGIVIDGKPLHGLVHPEMGHIRLTRPADDAFRGVCPFHGDCLEGLVAGPAVLARMGKTLSDVAADDPDRARVLDDLGQGLASFVVTLSPTRIVIGGGVAKSPSFHADVAARMRHWLGGYVANDVLDGSGYVVPPALGDRAGVAGGIALAQDLLERQGSARG